jgi:hypothetical protein
MACSVNPGNKIRLNPRPLSNERERRQYVISRQNLQEARSIVAVWTVVIAQRHVGKVRGAVPQHFGVQALERSWRNAW